MANGITESLMMRLATSAIAVDFIGSRPGTRLRIIVKNGSKSYSKKIAKGDAMKWDGRMYVTCLLQSPISTNF